MSNRRRIRPNAEPVTPMTEAPCGCKFGEVGDTFTFEPCSGRCELFRYFVKAAREQGKPLSVMDLRDVNL